MAHSGRKTGFSRRDLLRYSAAALLVCETTGMPPAFAEGAFTLGTSGGTWGDGIRKSFIDVPGFESRYNLKASALNAPTSVLVSRLLAQPANPPFTVADLLGYPLRSPYVASKWAIIGFTQTLAMELGPAGIRVNALLPGFVDGPRSRRLRTAQAAALGETVDAIESRMFAKTSMRRRVDPQDVANMALFVASDAGRNISGQSSAAPEVLSSSRPLRASACTSPARAVTPGQC